ncbi:PhzF family phenazine biosynthesis protein [Rugosimonospora acidiphila]|uniref:PhzF family phenazine biosynthesis protein n=1 Tax=Rugosimonospora acidiphila TaxID=556531 RepID=A0ABP9RIE2_9ACTN
MISLPYQIVDVFTDRPFTGNPLAVVFDAQDLAAEQLQALAREFNLSETAFVLPPTTPEATYRARIFTTETELPFAGHPSVGAAVTFAERAGREPGALVQECGAGLLPIQVYEGGKATLTGGPATVGEALDPTNLLAAAGLTDEDFVGPAPRIAGCGLEFPFVSITRDALARAAGDAAAARAAGLFAVSLVAWDEANRVAHTRVFFGSGMVEDPATGSAALGLGVWLVASGLLPGEGESEYLVEQGHEMGRPSTVECRVTARGGTVVNATATGRVVPIARGEIAVPPFVG